MTANDDDNPHYDDLIRELRELKKFIESNGDDASARQARADHPSNDGQAEERPRQTTPPPASPPHDDVGDDEPPTLREAVRRPPRRDEMQLDLLTVSRHEDDSADAPDAIDGRTIDTDGTPDTDGPASTSATPGQAQPANRDAHVPAIALAVDEDDEESDDAAYGEDADDEVVRFVLDLSDRILGTIEDKLLEHSGELLPNEVRGELREAIGDILYEWCER